MVGGIRTGAKALFSIGEVLGWILKKPKTLIPSFGTVAPFAPGRISADCHLPHLRKTRAAL